MANVNGFYGHTRKNHVRSLVMFAGFAVTLQIAIAALLASPITLLSQGELPHLFDRPVEYFKSFGPYVFACSIVLFYLNVRFHGAITKLATGFENIEPQENRALANMISRLAVTAGIAMPKIGIINTPALNCFACGRHEDDARIVFTQGLLRELTHEELEAVTAHEIAHIANGDIELMAYANASHSLNKWINFINPFQLRSFKLNIFTLFFMPILVPLILILSITGIAIKISSTLANFSRYFISSSREFIADAEAVRLTHNPAALMSALSKIEGRSQIHHLDPMTEAMMIDGAVDGEYASHPPVQERISALAQYSGSMIYGASTSLNHLGYQTHGGAIPAKTGGPVFGKRRQHKAAAHYRAKTQYRNKANAHILNRVNSDSKLGITGLPKTASMAILGVLGLFILTRVGMGQQMTKLAATQKTPQTSAPALDAPKPRPVKAVEYSDAYLAIDLSSHGLATTRLRSSKTYFYSQRAQRRQRTGWLGRRAGFIFYDINNDGKPSFGEILKTSSETAKQQTHLNFLKQYDSNYDGMIDKQDHHFNQFHIWTDFDKDGVATEKEVSPLARHTISTLNITGGEHFGPEGRVTATGAKLYSKTAINRPDGAALTKSYGKHIYLVSFETQPAQPPQHNNGISAQIEKKTDRDTYIAHGLKR